MKKDQQKKTVPVEQRRALKKMVAIRVILLVVILGAMLFLPAGTFRYWQAWTYMAILLIPFLLVVIFFLKKDPELLERRMRMREKEHKQKTIIMLSYPVFLAAFLLPGFDRRFGWSTVPVALVMVADIVVLASYALVVRVLWENRFASRIIEVGQEQKVIETGPYAVVRHPMYAAVLPMYLFSPLALGSFWALIPALLLPVILIARIHNEEEVLHRELDGYDDYARRVKYRLFPGIW